jgi:hypothetical protein
MNEAYKIIGIGVILAILNFVVLKVLPTLNVKLLKGIDMYVYFLDMLYIMYIVLPKEVGTIFVEKDSFTNK